MVNLCEAKTHLSELVDRAARGEEVMIAKAGEPKARLVPLGLTLVSYDPQIRGYPGVAFLPA